MGYSKHRKQLVAKALFIAVVFLLPVVFIFPVGASSSDEIKNMEYLFEFSHKNDDGRTTFKTKLQIEINHTGFAFPGNGTIRYTLEDPITEPLLLFMISSIFPIEFVEYFVDPKSVEYFQTSYYNRTESPYSDFNKSSIYTIFWMQEQQSYIDNFQYFDSLKFSNVSQPKTYVIDDIVTISHGVKRWSESFWGKLFDTQLVMCFIVSREYEIGADETYIHIYYDRATGVLLYGDYYLKNVGDNGRTEIQLEMHHISSDFQLASGFNWWLLLTIALFSIVGSLTGWIIYNLVRNGGRKKPSRLDEI